MTSRMSRAGTSFSGCASESTTCLVKSKVSLRMAATMSGAEVAITTSVGL